MRWIGSLAAVLIIAAAACMWRLMQGPVELNWLAPYVEAGFDRTGMGFKVTVQGVRFELDRSTHQLDLLAENVSVLLPDRRPLASFPEVSTSIALSELWRGQVAPTQVVVQHPVLHLIRDETGIVSAQIGGPQQAQGQQAQGQQAQEQQALQPGGDNAPPMIGPDLLRELAGPAEKGTFGLLHQIRVRGATLIVDDKPSGRTWRADRVDIAIQRGSKGVRGDISLAMPIGSSTPELRATYRFLTERQLLDLNIAIDGVQPTEIPPVIPELAQLQHVQAPVSGTLSTRIDTTKWRAQGSRLDLTLGKGQLRSEWLPTGTAPVRAGELHAVYAPERNEVQLEALNLDLDGGAQLAIDGTLTGITPELISAPAGARPTGHIGGNFNAALKNVPTDRLAQLWPKAFSAGGRQWVLGNVHDGMLDEAVIHSGVDLDPVARVGELLNAKGSLRYHDLTINYFNGLPMAQKISGTANFSGKELEFVPTSGSLKGLNISNGSVRLTDLGDKTEHLAVDLTLLGPLRDALEVLDSKPLRYAQAVGIDPAQVGGHSETQLHFKFPLVSDLKMDSVEYGAKATLAGVHFDRALFDRNITDGNVGLDVTKTGAHAQGTMKFDGIPSKVDAQVFFHEKTGAHAVYKVGLTLDDDAQRRLQLDLSPDRLSGPIGVEATYQTLAGNRGEATALLDLRNATMSIPEAGWKKTAAQPGTAKVVLDVDADHVSGVRQIDVRAAGLDGRFTATLAPDRKHLDRLEIRRLVVNESDVTGLVTRHGNGWQADIRAARVDARHLIKDSTTGQPSAESTPLAVNARIDRLVFGPQRELRQVTGTLQRTAGVWNSGRVDARFVNGRQMALRFGENGSQQLLFQADDLGATLQLLDMGADVTGGRLTVDGQLSESNGRRTLRAHVEGSNYTVTKASPMTRILALPSFTGFASMLSGTGLPFATLRGDFVYSGNRLTLDRLLAFGEAIGITANGWFDLDRDQLELQGTVAPAYLLNSLIGNVPIIGQLLGGGSQGLFAGNFRLSGSSDNPQVTVNPLSALAPGILRQLFAPIVGLPGPPQPPEQAPATAAQRPVAPPMPSASSPAWAPRAQR